MWEKKNLNLNSAIDICHRIPSPNHKILNNDQEIHRTLASECEGSRI